MYPPYIVGDINNDGHIDVVDLLYLADSWGKVIGQAGYDAGNDLNGDFAVDVLDLLAMAGNWGL